MAKTVSPIFKFQGTIDDLTFVDSRRYKPHVRARKHSKTPFVMTAPLAESKSRLQQCNQYAKPVFQALRAESHDGGLWSRLVSQLFAELKAGRPLGLECLKGFECNLQHPMGEVITKGYDLSATVSQNQLGIYVQLHAHPKVADEMPRTGYQLRFVAIIPDAANGTVQKVEVLGPLTKYDDELTAHGLPIALPGNGAPCMLLMGIVPHLQAEGPARIMSDSGMRVVWVGADERQATSGELRTTSGGEDGMAKEEISVNGTTEVVERQAMSYELPPQRDKLRAAGEREDACAECQSQLASANDEWDDGATIVSGANEKGPEPLLIDTAGDPGKGMAAGADHEDAAFVLPFKNRLAERAHHEDGTLLNPDSYRDQRASSGSDEIILHNKTFKNEKITAKAACSIQCGMSARPKRNAEYMSGLHQADILAEAGAG